MLVTLGVVIRATSNNSTEFRIRYDDKCTSHSNLPCSFNFYVKEKIKGPLYFYIHFRNFYLPHRKVMRSFSSSQIAGKDRTNKQLERACPGKFLNKHLGVTKALDGSNVPEDGQLIPCGIMPSLFPRDKFSLEKLKDDLKTTEKSLPLDISKITYKKLQGNKYKNYDLKKQYINVEDRRFSFN